MLGLAPTADVLDAVDTPGGFCWWYADLVSPTGDGVVVIGAFGLPFLPGQRALARQGALPRARPSLAVSVYRAGRCVAYQLTVHDPARVTVAPDRIDFGASRLVSRVQGDTRVFRAALDCAVPGSTERLTGTVDIAGPVVRGDGPPEASDHLWTPLTTATTGRATLAVGGRPLLDTTGRAYHDGNASRVPLDRLGIDRWLWGRAPRGDAEHVWYALWPTGGGPPRTLSLLVRPDGTLESTPCDAVEGPARRGRYGFPGVGSLQVGDTRVDHVHVVDDGPFYQRYLARAGGELGIAEALVPDRVDRPAHRPFVRMAVHDLSGANSPFLPLFVGPGADRWRRLLDWNLGRAS